MSVFVELSSVPDFLSFLTQMATNGLEAFQPVVLFVLCRFIFNVPVNIGPWNENVCLFRTGVAQLRTCLNNQSPAISGRLSR